jgi:damage-control phosphatase, subfamily II, stand-alone protein
MTPSQMNQSTQMTHQRLRTNLTASSSSSSSFFRNKLIINNRKLVLLWKKKSFIQSLSSVSNISSSERRRDGEQRISTEGSARPDEAEKFPLLHESKEYSHVSPGVCDLHARDKLVRKEWVVLLRSQHASHRANAQRTFEMFHKEEDGEYMERYRKWEIAYDLFLSEVESDSYEGGTLLNVVSAKERMLREHSLEDLFKAVKASENALCSDVLFNSLRDDVDFAEDSLKAAIEIALAGNLFDAGAAQAVQNVIGGTAFKGDQNKFAFKNSDDLQSAFEASRKRVRTSKWLCDDYEALKNNLYDRVVIFCDNAGADLLGMTLLAREFSRRTPDAKVALVANELAALNDVTISELREFYNTCENKDVQYLKTFREINKIALLSSGQASTLLNLNVTGKEINDWVKLQDMDSKNLKWLVVLDGMGRSLESNWDCGKYFQNRVDVLNLAMVKSEINAKRLNANVYDCVCKLSSNR